MGRRIIVANDGDELAIMAGDVLIDLTVQAIDQRGRAVILVSGGTSVWSSYENFGKAKAIDWSKVYVFWGDDRFVEPGNPYSNYTLVRESLLVNADGLPRENIFPINYKASTPTACAEEYSEAIRRFFHLAPGEWPVFDLAQNGMGPDGHTASIFPHTPAALIDDKIAVANHAGLKPWVDRITLTLPVFNRARAIVFVTAGPTKAEKLKTVIEGDPPVEEAPAAHIHPENGTVFWLVDQAAAAELTIPVDTKI
jgi:6-phosphogluconolactonase